MLIFSGHNYVFDDHAFLCPVRPPEGVIVCSEKFRSGDKYRSDLNARVKAFGAILRSVKGFPQFSLYSVLADQDSYPIGKVRSYKGFVPFASSLRKLEYRNLEVSTSDSCSRLGCVVFLDTVIPFDETDELLSSSRSVLVLTRLGIEEVSSLALLWMGGAPSRYPSLDYVRILESVSENDSMVVLRHIGPIDDATERVVAICRDNCRDLDPVAILDRIVI